jgi:putative membrane protein
MAEPETATERGGSALLRTVPTVVIALAAMAFAVHALGNLDVTAVIAIMARMRAAGAAQVVGLHLAAAAVLGLAWKVLVPAAEAVGIGEFVAARLVRDAVGDLLPLSQLGGYAAGARVVGLLGLAPGMAVASTCADIATEMIAQIAHLLAGTAVLAGSGIAGPATSAAAVGALLAVPAATGFVVVQVYGTRILPGPIRRRWPVLSRPGDGVQDGAVRRIWLGAGHPSASILIHLAAWLLLGCQALAILHALGIHVGWVRILAAEAMLQGVRSLAFAVPNAVGVQEVAYAVLGQALGFGAEAGVALSLIKRARDVAIGTPVLFLWLLAEGRTWGRAPHTRRKQPTTSASSRM